MTFLILLNDNFEGGETQFLVNADQPGKPAKRGDRQAQITKGVKYIIRTDMLFEI